MPADQRGDRRRSSGTPRLRRRRRSLTVVALIAFAVLAGACTPAAETRLAESRTPVLVPTDNDFRGEFRFTLNDAAEIYDIFTNVDSEFNPDIDTTLGVQGWQINDVAVWNDHTPGASDRDRELLRGVVQAAIDTAGGGSGCGRIDGDVTIYACGPTETPFVIRFADEPGNALLLVPDRPATRRFLTQRFEVVDLDRAEPWFTTANP